MNCDILIPVVEACEEIESTLQTLLAHTDMRTNRIVLIGDGAEVCDLLRSFTETQGVVLLENAVPAGAVGCINRGMRFAGCRDVAVLLPGTVVTGGWLKKLEACACSSRAIGASAPLCSGLQLGSADAETVAGLAETMFSGVCADTAAVCGHCVYLKRSTLDLVGLPDAGRLSTAREAVQDIWLRCQAVGLRTVVAEDAYVQDTCIGEEEPALAQVGQLLRLALQLQKNTAPNVLIVIQLWADICSVLGGTGLHVWDIINGQRERFNFHVFVPTDGGYELVSYWQHGGEATKLLFDCPREPFGVALYNEQYGHIVDTILHTCSIQVVHVHHMMGHYLDVIERSKARGLKVLYSFHDFYALCPLIHKLGTDGRYCGAGSSDQCAVCLAEQGGGARIRYWREGFHRQLQQCDRIIAPTASARAEVLAVYGDLAVDVLEHGIDMPKTPPRYRERKGSFNVAFLGSIGKIKGLSLLQGLIPAIEGTELKLHLIGVAHGQLPQGKRFVNCGSYLREELPRKLEQHEIDLICLLSVCSETYGYTLTEAAACGVPVVAFDLGAVAERIWQDNLGYVIPLTDDAEEVKARLLDISRNRKEYEDKLHSIEGYAIKSTAAMAEEYAQLYVQYCREGDGFDLSALSRLMTETAAMMARQPVPEAAPDPDYERIVNSLRWKLVSKLKLPGFVGKAVRGLLGK